MARVLLPKEIQYQLCFSARKKLGVNWAGLAKYLQISPSTLANWYRCERLLPQEIFSKLENIAGISIQKPTLLNDNWGWVKGGRISVAKHGRSFWTLEGSRKGGVNSAKKFVLPQHSGDLAEFIGIMLGDGGIARGQISITLGYTTDFKYVPYIKRLVRKLFRAKMSTYHPKNKDVIRMRVSGVNLVKNLCVLGLICGDKVKHQVGIPSWIFKRKLYKVACIRGLIDTDGCVYKKERKEKNGLEYRSVAINFKTASMPLQKSLRKLFSDLNFKTSVSGRTLYLYGKEQILRYVNKIGFSNPKHIARYQNFLQNYGWVKVKSKIV